MKPEILSYRDMSFSNRWNHHDGWLDGVVFTKFGIVDVMAERNFARLRFVHNGRCYDVRYRQTYSRRYLTTLANRFARQIANGKGKSIDG